MVRSLLGVLAATVAATWIPVLQFEAFLRDEKRSEVVALSEAFDPGRVRELRGDSSDLGRWTYVSLKQQLSALRRSDPDRRFVYLLAMGTRGEIRILVDDQPAGSPDLSPPGQEFAEVPARLKDIFRTGRADVVGPVSDRWGTWVTSAAPIFDPATGHLVAVLGVDVAVADWNASRRASAVPGLLLGVALLGIHVLWRRGRDRGGVWIQPIAVVAAGVAITLQVAWMASRFEQFARQSVSRSLAAGRSGEIAVRLRDIPATRLEDLSRGLEAGIDPERLATEKSDSSGVARGWGIVSLAGGSPRWKVLDGSGPVGSSREQASRLARGAAADCRTFSTDPVEGSGGEVELLVLRRLRGGIPRNAGSPAWAYLRLEPARAQPSGARRFSGGILRIEPDGTFRPVVDFGGLGEVPPETRGRPVLADGRTYEIRLGLGDDPWIPASNGVAWAVMAPGIALTVLLALLVAGESRKRLKLEEELRRRVSQIRESEARFRTLFDDSPDAHLLLALDGGGIVQSNRAARTMLRGSPSEIHGKFPHEFSPEFQPDGRDSVEAARERVEQGFRDGEVRFEWLHRRLDGEVFWVDVSLAVLVLDGRKMLLLSWRDISERKALDGKLRDAELRARAQRDALGAIVRGAIDGADPVDQQLERAVREVARALRVARASVWTFDASGDRLECRVLWSEGAGIEHPGRVLERAGHPIYFAALAESLAVAIRDLRTDPRSAEFRGSYLEREGVSSMLDTKISMEGLFGGVLCAEQVGAPRDWHSDEEAFAGAAASVVGQILSNEELRRQRAAAESASRAKSEFLANMSHEIRTPLNGVIGFTELLLGTGLEPTQREWLESAHRSGRALLEVVNDILDFSKIEAGRMELDPVPTDLRSLVGQASEILRPVADAKGIGLDWSVSPAVPRRVRVDPQRLRQILVNLLGNAVKFTERGGVVLSAGWAPSEGGGMATFSVRDTGVGIGAEQMDRLFQAFSQGDASTTRRFGGTGLGLAISGRLAGMMGGRIEVRSRPGEGSEFGFGVDAPDCSDDAPESAVDGEGSAEAEDWNRRRSLPWTFLVAEDVPVNKVLVRALLKGQFPACTIIEASNGEAAVRAVAEGGVDLVLMDAHMPVMDGLEATRAIRRREEAAGARRLPVVALTAGVLAEERRNADAAGMDAFLPKPLECAKLREAIARLLPAHPARLA